MYFLRSVRISNSIQSLNVPAPFGIKLEDNRRCYFDIPVLMPQDVFFYGSKQISAAQKRYHFLIKMCLRVARIRVLIKISRRIVQWGKNFINRRNFIECGSPFPRSCQAIPCHQCGEFPVQGRYTDILTEIFFYLGNRGPSSGGNYIDNRLLSWCHFHGSLILSQSHLNPIINDRINVKK